MMKKLLILLVVFSLGITLVACHDNDTYESNESETVEEETGEEEASESVLDVVTIEVIAHENHDDHDHEDEDHHDHDDDDDHDHGSEAIGDTHHFHFAVEVDGTVIEELHGTSSNHFELKLTPAGGYSWAEEVTPVINLPEFLEESTITSYIDDHGCLVIIVQFPESE